MFEILVTDLLDPLALERLKKEADVNLHYKPQLKSAELGPALKDIDGLIADRETEISAETLKAGNRLKVIGRAGLRTSHIDVDSATEQGILILNLPHGHAVSAAEHTFALLLAACRQFHKLQHVEDQNGIDRAQLHIHNLFGKRLGLIGLDQVGMLLIPRAQAFGLDVVVYDPHTSEQIAQDLDFELVDLDDLLERVDIISLHLPSGGKKRAVLNEETVALIRPGTIVINATSPHLMDQAAVLGGLENGQIAALALDGPLTTDQADPIQTHPNLFITPELAQQSLESRQKSSIEIAENLLAALRQKSIRYPVNYAIPPESDYQEIAPFADLALKIGMIQAQLTPQPITKVEIELSGDELRSLVRPIGANILMGILSLTDQQINQINAPYFAKKKGIKISQEYDISRSDYSNLITCRVHWHTADGTLENRLIAGVLFGGREPRIVQVDDYQLEAKPEGKLLVLSNRDVPGVIGQVATLLATYNVNIAEWRLGRLAPGSEALSFINLDGEPPRAIIDALQQAPAITAVYLIHLPTSA